MPTQIYNGEQFLRGLMAGSQKLCDAVGSTLGPNGRNAIVHFDKYRITKDGVTVANSIFSFADPVENMALQLIKEAANKTASEAGDGTTTATVLTHQIVSNGILLL